MYTQTGYVLHNIHKNTQFLCRFNTIIDIILFKALEYADLLTGNATALPNPTKCPDQ